MAAAAAFAEVDQCLQWIGFTDVQHRNTIIPEGGFNGLNDFFDVTETDIRDMAESFSKRSPAANCINFGMRRIKWLIAMMNWCQDHQRCSEEPGIADFAKADTFKEALQVSVQIALLRKNDSDQVNTISKAADPGKFKDEKKWPDWEPAFVNYLSTIPGVKGIPLSYVVCANEDPGHETNFDGDFVVHLIACAPLNNATFRADARKVHQLLMKFLVAESAEQWIKNLAPRVNGCLDMEALRNHYSGEGNASRHIATAEKLRETLHYKSERSLPFSNFLDRMQKMFNIFQEEGKELTENAKVHELLKRVQNNQLQDTVKALPVRFDLDGISYTEAANHLISAVSELPEYLLACHVSSLKRICGGGSEKGKNKFKRDSIYVDDGTIFTGYYSNWKSLSKEDRDKVIAERKKKNMPGVAKNDNKHKLAKIQALTEHIAMMKHMVSQLAATKHNQEEQDDDAPCNDAGNQFGGGKATAGK